MSVRTKFLAVAIAAAAIVGAATSASATTITQNAFYANSSGGYSQSFNFNGFNTSLGTLNSITLTLTLNETAFVEIFNNTLLTQSYTNATATFHLSASVSAPGSITTSLTLPVAAGPFAGSIASHDIIDLLGTTDTSSSSTNVPTGQFSFYEAPSVIVTATLFGDTGDYIGNAAAHVFFSGDVSGSTTATLVYDYTPSRVPEPLTLSLFGAGLAGAAALRRRKKQNA